MGVVKKIVIGVLVMCISFSTINCVKAKADVYIITSDYEGGYNTDLIPIINSLSDVNKDIVYYINGEIMLTYTGLRDGIYRPTLRDYQAADQIENIIAMGKRLIDYAVNNNDGTVRRISVNSYLSLLRNSIVYTSGLNGVHTFNEWLATAEKPQVKVNKSVMDDITGIIGGPLSVKLREFSLDEYEFEPFYAGLSSSVLNSQFLIQFYNGMINPTSSSTNFIEYVNPNTGLPITYAFFDISDMYIKLYDSEYNEVSTPYNSFYKPKGLRNNGDTYVTVTSSSGSQYMYRRIRFDYNVNTDIYDVARAYLNKTDISIGGVQYRFSQSSIEFKSSLSDFQYAYPRVQHILVGEDIESAIDLTVEVDLGLILPNNDYNYTIPDTDIILPITELTNEIIENDDGANDINLFDFLKNILVDLTGNLFNIADYIIQGIGTFNDEYKPDFSNISFMGVSGFISKLWEYTKPIVVYTKDLLSALTFGNDGFAFVIYGVVVLGLAGGVISKLLL